MSLLEILFSEMSIGGIIITLAIAAIVLQRMLEPTLFAMIRAVRGFRSHTDAAAHPAPSLRAAPRAVQATVQEWKRAAPHEGLAAYKQKNPSVSERTLH